MASIPDTTKPAHSPADAVSYGLDLDSALNDFSISFSNNPSFSNDRPSNYVVNLSKEWKDDMGLHLLQRSMLPPRSFKCIITLAGSLRVAEDYAGSMKLSVKVPLADLVLDEQKTTTSGNDFVLQMKLVDPSKTFTLQDNFDTFDRLKVRIGGPAIQEIKARGFQLAERDVPSLGNQSALFGPIIIQCRYLRITIKEWQAINDPEVFSPEVTSMIGSESSHNAALKGNTHNQAETNTLGSSEESAVTTHKLPIVTKRPCSCWERDENGRLDKAKGGADESSAKHSDACESHWAALFGDYVQANKLKQARVGSGGMMASRWAAGA